MCGRFAFRLTARELVRALPGLRLRQQDCPSSDEVFPTDPVLMLTGDGTRYVGGSARWGLVGSFLDAAPPRPLINLRSDGLETRPFYSKILKRSRCLIPASGFYEWQTVSGGTRQKMRFSLADGHPLMFAGVFDQHRIAGTTCAILTTAASGSVAAMHERMPLILGREAREFWLAEHPEFPVGEFAEVLGARSAPSLVMEPVTEPEPSPQLAFAFG